MGTVEESVTSRISTVVRSQVPRGTEIHRGCVRGHVANQRASINCVNTNRGQTTGVTTESKTAPWELARSGAHTTVLVPHHHHSFSAVQTSFDRPPHAAEAQMTAP